MNHAVFILPLCAAAVILAVFLPAVTADTSLSLGTAVLFATPKSDEQEYLLHYDPNGTSGINTFSQYTYKTSGSIQILSPNSVSLTFEERDKIRNEFSYFEKCLYSYDFSSADYGISKFVDMQSFADWYIIQELCMDSNADAYVYKDAKTGLYKMCLPDFIFALRADDSDKTAFLLDEYLWYDWLLKDKDFVKTVVYRYGKLRGSLLSDESIRSMAGPGEADQLLLRVAWLDENIGSLESYCSDSAVKKYIDNAN